MNANPKANSVAPTPIASPGGRESSPEQAPEENKEFHFAVTWVTLFAHLDLVDAAGPRPRVENPVPALALVPVVATQALVEQRAEQGPKAAGENAAWEMVVPKMVRNQAGDFSPAESARRRLL
jgi:hypothetical protein